MTDRKINTIMSDISSAHRDVEEIKSAQYFGHDTTEIKMATNDVAYDLVKTIAAGDRYDFVLDCWNDDDVYPAHTIGYNQLLYQVWIGNLSTPYVGESSGIGIFTPVPKNSPFAPGDDTLSVEMINVTSSPITVYIKAYVVTTYTNANVQAYEGGF